MKDMLDQENNNLMCYSKSMLMEAPKPGYEKEWKETKGKVQLLEQMISELPHRRYDPTTDKGIKESTFIGYISGYEFGKTKTDDPHPYITSIRFCILDPGEDILNEVRKERIFEISHNLGIEWLVSNKFDEERHARYDQGLDNLLRITVQGTTITDLAWENRKNLEKPASEKLQDRINSANDKNQKVLGPHTVVKQHEQQL
ncbi:MAG TPA: hypothetical protein VHP31_08750 [Caproicibacter sp.]|nr:hypothetical protein [Caproicibacter sp.]